MNWKIIFAAAAILLSCTIYAMKPGSEYAPAEPTSPGSGEYAPVAPTGPEPTGPGSGEYAPVAPTGPEPSGPGSGEYAPAEPSGPGSGEYAPAEPSGPGSGEYAPAEPTGPGSGEYENEGPGSGEEVSNSNYYKNKARGSCNVVERGSTCVEYIGSFWTWDNIVPNCTGAGTPSQSACPRPFMGGCNMGQGTLAEIITWHYEGLYDAENIQHAARVCNALPTASWVINN